jgi:hypothetical protein
LRQHRVEVRKQRNTKAGVHDSTHTFPFLSTRGGAVRAVITNPSQPTNPFKQPSPPIIVVARLPSFRLVCTQKPPEHPFLEMMRNHVFTELHRAAAPSCTLLLHRAARRFPCVPMRQHRCTPWCHEKTIPKRVKHHQLHTLHA